jgi:hypothetical protein
MEEHIGKRVNTERTEEAIDTGASRIATGCPFCRVMMTDGVDEVAAARDIEKVEVLDVAQLLLGSLDTSTVTLPEKGAAAKEAEERAAKTPAAKAPAAKATAAAPAPTPEKATAEAPAEKSEKSEAPAAKASTGTVTGLGVAAGAKRPGAKKKTAAAPAETKAENSEAPAAAPAKGLGIAAGARRPGAKKAPAEASPNEGAGTVVQPPNVDPDKAAAGTEAADSADSDLGLASKPEPEVKGLGIASGARRPGAKKKAPAPAAKPADEPTTESAPAAEAERPAQPESAAGTGDARVVGDEPPVKGLGIAKGARRPGKR